MKPKKNKNKGKPMSREIIKSVPERVKRIHSPISEEGGQVKEEVLHDAMFGGGGDVRKKEHIEETMEAGRRIYPLTIVT